MNRREVIFRVGGLLLAIPASRVLLACGSDSGGGTNPQSLTFTSSNELAHTHTVSLQLTEISTPPAAGVTKTTSNDLAHTHMVSLTAADLDSINQGNTVTKTTTNDDNHTHSFAFRKS
ncbi:MAG TPA: hypothetical protein VMT11_01960 [Myxococcaceae bacterium]|nr:hypothetical protein [Myxococcaceae bacterium]